MMLFINKMFNLKMKILIFYSFFVVVKMTERRKNQSEKLTYFTYFITVNKYRFCISVIGYINVQSIGYKKNLNRSITNSYEWT